MQVRLDWPNAEICWHNAKAESLTHQIFSRNSDPANELRCFVRGSHFQTQVWRALLRIPPGHLATYEQIAEAVGKPKASRAVGNAVATNVIGYLIPCHRVIRKTGVVGHYRWGQVRKQAVIGYEASMP